MKELLGVDEYGNDVYKITSKESVNFYCEHCGDCKDTVYYDTGVIWCSLCITTIKIIPVESKIKL